MTQTQVQQIFSYFKKNPNRDIPCTEVAEWADNIHRKKTGKFLSPSRSGSVMRALYSAGKIIRIAKGVYRYNPNPPTEPKKQFTAKQKKEIYGRDGHQCVLCGLGKRDDVQIRAALIYPLAMGGKHTTENAFTLCVKHYIAKQKTGGIGIDMALEFFVETYEKALKSGDQKTQQFCESMFGAYEKNNPQQPAPAK